MQTLNSQAYTIHYMYLVDIYIDSDGEYECGIVIVQVSRIHIHEFVALSSLSFFHALTLAMSPSKARKMDIVELNY